MKPDLLRRYPRTAAPFHRLVTNQRLLILLLAMALLVLAACAQLGPLSPGTATSALGPADAAKTGQGWFLHLRGEAELTGHIGFQIIHRNITVDGFEVSRKNITVEVNPGDKLAMIGPRLVNKLRLWGIDVTCSAIKEDRFIIGISHADQPPQELLGGVAGLVLGTNGPILSFQELERCELGGRNGKFTPSPSPTLASPTLVTPRLPAGYPALYSEVRYLDREFSPTIGPVRADLLAVKRLESTGLALKDKLVEPSKDGNPVFAVPGVPLDEGFLVLFHGNDSPVAEISGLAYPTCQPGVHAYAYTAVGAAPPPPPLGPVTPSAPYPGGPTPTPVPTPSSGPFPTALSADGLLAGGWPRINLERVQPKYLGVTYRSTGGGNINDRRADTSIAPDILEELEVLSITYRVDVNLPAPLTSLVIDQPVTDRVRVFRFMDRPGNEVIIVEQCPADFQGDQYLFYKAREPK